MFRFYMVVRAIEKLTMLAQSGADIYNWEALFGLPHPLFQKHTYFSERRILKIFWNPRANWLRILNLGHRQYTSPVWQM